VVEVVTSDIINEKITEENRKFSLRQLTANCLENTVTSTNTILQYRPGFDAEV
jgi:hypothetical protein